MGQQNSKKDEIVHTLHTPIPKEHNVVLSIYSNHHRSSPYGTSAFLKILKTPSTIPELNEFLKIKKKEFIELRDNIYDTRQQKLTDLVYNLEMCDNEDEILRYISPSEHIQKYKLSQIILNPWISTDTFNYFIANFQGFFEQDDISPFLIRNLVMEINDIKIKSIKKDFLLNWGFFPNYLVNTPDWIYTDIYSDNEYAKRLKKLMDKVVLQIQSAYKIDSSQFIEISLSSEKALPAISRRTDPAISLRSERVKPAASRLIPEGFYFYRAYEKDKDIWGDLENGMWASVNGSDIIAYITSQIGRAEDGSINNTLFDYCEGVRNLAVFKTNRALNLLDFSKKGTKEYIYHKMEESGRNDLAELFKNTYITIRDSDKQDDQKIAIWLCENGYDGYIGFQDPFFHDEVMICRQRESLTLLELYNGNDIGLTICEEPYKNYNLVLEMI